MEPYGRKKIPLNRVIILGVKTGIAGKFNKTQEEAIKENFLDEYFPFMLILRENRPNLLFKAS